MFEQSELGCAGGVMRGGTPDPAGPISPNPGQHHTGHPAGFHQTLISPDPAGQASLGPFLPFSCQWVESEEPPSPFHGGMCRIAWGAIDHGPIARACHDTASWRSIRTMPARPRHKRLSNGPASAPPPSLDGPPRPVRVPLSRARLSHPPPRSRPSRHPAASLSPHSRSGV